LKWAIQIEYHDFGDDPAEEHRAGAKRDPWSSRTIAAEKGGEALICEHVS
jgi:hypothetical protein